MQIPCQLTIGRLAAASGVSRDTVRYYERLKLLPRPGRTRSGYRVFSEDDIQRVRFIKAAQTIGLSLAEIKELLPVGKAGVAECRRVRDALTAKLQQVDKRLAEILALKAALTDSLKECEAALAGGGRTGCPVVSRIKSS